MTTIKRFMKGQVNKYTLMHMKEVATLGINVLSYMVRDVLFVVLILKRSMVELEKVLFMYIILSRSLILVKHIKSSLRMISVQFVLIAT